MFICILSANLAKDSNQVVRNFIPKFNNFYLVEPLIVVTKIHTKYKGLILDKSQNKKSRHTYVYIDYHPTFCMLYVQYFEKVGFPRI